jgi:hypothetical protein
MQIYLPILALALGASAIDQPNQKCVDFIKVQTGAPQKSRRERVRRGWFDDESTVAGATTAEVTTELTSTAAMTSTDMPATTVEVTSVQTPEPTTNGPTTAEPTTQTSEQTTSAGATTTIATTDSVNEEDKAILVILDETGSMQDLGGPYCKGKGCKKGREVVLQKMEKFREHLENSVNSGGDDYPITFVTFNKAARWNKYNSIKDWPMLTESDYNPGYSTNLFDTLGCVLSKYKSENPNQSVQVYLISDGVQTKSIDAAYDESTISTMIEELRDDHWNFQFFGAVNADKKNALKFQAKRLGFRAAELRVFSFDGQAFGSLLKTMLRSVGVTKPKKLPDCKVLKSCKKGRRGRFCRKGRKSLERQGKCKFY